MKYYNLTLILFLSVPQYVYAQNIWDTVIYYSKDYHTGLKFSSGKRQVGVFDEPEGRFLIQENKDTFKEIDTQKHGKSIITAWMEGSKTHVVRVFNSRVSASSPICSLHAWGDPQFESKMTGTKVLIKIKEAEGKMPAWQLCYDFAQKNKSSLNK